MLENNSPTQNLIKVFGGQVYKTYRIHTQHSIKLIGKQADWQAILQSPAFENPTDSPDLKDLKDCCRERR
jgi:hypothetical protein